MVLSCGQTAVPTERAPLRLAVLPGLTVKALMPPREMTTFGYEMSLLYEDIGDQLELAPLSSSALIADTKSVRYRLRRTSASQATAASKQKQATPKQDLAVLEGLAASFAFEGMTAAHVSSRSSDGTAELVVEFATPQAAQRLVRSTGAVATGPYASTTPAPIDNRHGVLLTPKANGTPLLQLVRAPQRVFWQLLVGQQVDVSTLIPARDVPFLRPDPRLTIQENSSQRMVGLTCNPDAVARADRLAIARAARTSIIAFCAPDCAAAMPGLPALPRLKDSIINEGEIDVDETDVADNEANSSLASSSSSPHSLPSPPPISVLFARGDREAELAVRTLSVALWRKTGKHLRLEEVPAAELGEKMVSGEFACTVGPAPADPTSFYPFFSKRIFAQLQLGARFGSDWRGMAEHFAQNGLFVPLYALRTYLAYQNNWCLGDENIDPRSLAWIADMHLCAAGEGGEATVH